MRSCIRSLAAVGVAGEEVAEVPSELEQLHTIPVALEVAAGESAQGRPKAVVAAVSGRQTAGVAEVWGTQTEVGAVAGRG